MMGPNLPALCDILLRWRRHQYVLATDVKKMYRQIQVHEDDRDLQKILWRYNSSEEIREYCLNIVRLSVCPFSGHAHHEAAHRRRRRFPKEANALRQDVYMDDILTGADTIEPARELQRQLSDLCMAGGFLLRKTKKESLLENLPAEHRMWHEPRSLTSAMRRSVFYGILASTASLLQFESYTCQGQEICAVSHRLTFRSSQMAGFHRSKF